MSLVSLVRQQLEPWLTAKRWVIAFSGGVDSVALLSAVAVMRQQQATPPLVALHIHHGLQATAEAWPAFCQQLATALGVEFSWRQVQVDQRLASVEQAARDARYRGFSEFIQPGEVLLTGHHLDDQAETVLFRALRGSGVLGLAAMPVQRPLAAGQLVRPLLQVSKQQLEHYVRAQGLSWVEDPSNLSDSYDRNFIRNQVIPLLTQRWPQATQSLARVAQHSAEAQQLLDELAAQDLQQAQLAPAFSWLSLPSLDLTVIQQLSMVRQKNLLRYWLRDFSLMPDAAHWQGWFDLRDAQPDKNPLWRLAGGQVQRYQQRLYWLSNAWLQAAPFQSFDLGQQTEWTTPQGLVQLTGVTPLARPQFRISTRQGGERLQLAGRGQRDLKRLLQEVQLPSFLRDRIPLLWHQQQLVAVANFPQLTAAGFESLEFCWQPWPVF